MPAFTQYFDRMHLCVSIQNLFLLPCDSIFKKQYTVNTVVQLEDTSDFWSSGHIHLHVFNSSVQFVL